MGGSDLDVCAYLDFRAYLRDCYNARKAGARGFSYRSFSRRAGLTSPNYLKLVIDGKRNLSADMAGRFAEACGLKGDDARYFTDLVAFGQATGRVKSEAHYARLTGFQRYRSAHRLDLAHAAYYSAWFMPAIRELAARTDFDARPEWIAQQLVPAITGSEARRALETLLELGLLVREPDGSVRQRDVLLSTGAETRCLHIVNYHRTMMVRALESIDLIPKEERDTSSLTLCLGRDGVRAFKERVQRFRRELLELSARQSDPEPVVQMNFQVFLCLANETRRTDEVHGQSSGAADRFRCRLRRRRDG